MKIKKSLSRTLHTLYQFRKAFWNLSEKSNFLKKRQAFFLTAFVMKIIVLVSDIIVFDLLKRSENVLIYQDVSNFIWYAWNIHNCLQLCLWHYQEAEAKLNMCGTTNSTDELRLAFFLSFPSRPEFRFLTSSWHLAIPMFSTEVS